MKEETKYEKRRRQLSAMGLGRLNSVWPGKDVKRLRDLTKLVAASEQKAGVLPLAIQWHEQQLASLGNDAYLQITLPTVDILKEWFSEEIKKEMLASDKELAEAKSKATTRGLSRKCKCGYKPKKEGTQFHHKCCPAKDCNATANGIEEITESFGYRTVPKKKHPVIVGWEKIPQSYCKECRKKPRTEVKTTDASASELG